MINLYAILAVVITVLVSGVLVSVLPFLIGLPLSYLFGLIMGKLLDKMYYRHYSNIFKMKE